MEAAAIAAWAKTAKATEAFRTPAMQQARDRLIEQHRMRPARIAPTYFPAKIANPPGVAAVAAQLKEQIRASGLPTDVAAAMQSHFRTRAPTPRISDLVGQRMRQQGIGVVPRISDLPAEQGNASLPRLDLISGEVSPVQPLDAAPVDPEAVRTLVRQRLEDLIAESVNRIARAKQAAGRVRIMYWLPELRFLWVLTTVYAAVCMEGSISPVLTTSVQLGFETAGLVEKRRR